MSQLDDVLRSTRYGDTGLDEAEKQIIDLFKQLPSMQKRAERSTFSDDLDSDTFEDGYIDGHNDTVEQLIKEIEKL